MCIYLWWPILYTYLHLVTYSVHEEYSDFVAYFFFFFLVSFFFITYFMAYRFSYLCLPILYNYLLFILITHHFLPIFYKYHFMTYFVHMRLLWPILFICISFLALSLHILRRRVRLPLVTLLYTYLLLVTYSVHMKNFWQLTDTSQFWPKFMT